MTQTTADQSTDEVVGSRACHFSSAGGKSTDPVKMVVVVISFGFYPPVLLLENDQILDNHARRVDVGYSIEPVDDI
uniref:Uncharacterized protein n=1 Tax=Peronospora matthiolae TaxID=2874970 RepID=A0AAV1UA61_9STRA